MFVALIAGPIARPAARRPPARSVLAAGFVGAVLVLGADLVAQHLLPVELPTGVVTGVVGAPYLLWLLATVNREGGRMTSHDLRAEELTLAYDADASCRASTLRSRRSDHRHRRRERLRQVDPAAGLARLLAPTPRVGAARRRSVHEMRSVEVARVLGLLPQSPVAPDGITVADLVGRGRYPHQGWFRQWSPSDDARRRRGAGRPRAPPSSPIARSPNCPAGSASGCGSRWRWRRRPTSCCSTSRRRSSTSATRSSCSTC